MAKVEIKPSKFRFQVEDKDDKTLGKKRMLVFGVGNIDRDESKARKREWWMNRKQNCLK